MFEDDMAEEAEEMAPCKPGFGATSGIAFAFFSFLNHSVLERDFMVPTVFAMGLEIRAGPSSGNAL